MLSRSMSSLVMIETVLVTSSIGRLVRVAAVVTASSWVGCAWELAGSSVSVIAGGT